MRNQTRMKERQRGSEWASLTLSGRLVPNSEVAEHEHVPNERHFPIQNICSCSLCGKMFSYETCPNNTPLATQRMNLSKARAIRHYYKCQTQKHEEAQEQSKEQKLFYELIAVYNKTKQHHEHHIDLEDGRVMVIEWDGRWNYRIHALGRLEKDGA